LKEALAGCGGCCCCYDGGRWRIFSGDDWSCGGDGGMQLVEVDEVPFGIVRKNENVCFCARFNFFKLAFQNIL
jgi:hypothetical protein